MTRRAELIEDFHTPLIQSHGNELSLGYRVCGWSGASSQRARFLAMLRASSFRGGSVVDYGCGTGDLYQVLVETGFDFEYRGLDQSASMISLARKFHSAHFEHIALDSVAFEPADYVFASGLFQFRDPSSPYYYASLVTQLFERSRFALALNFLSDLRDEADKRDQELYLPPAAVVGLAATLSPYWVLDQSYHVGRGDMTLALLRVAAPLRR